MDTFIAAEEHGVIRRDKALHTNNTLFNSRGVHACIKFSLTVFARVFVFHE